MFIEVGIARRIFLGGDILRERDSSWREFPKGEGNFHGGGAKFSGII